jgi:hypothetical protein
MTTQQMGEEGFRWWLGVVEDIQDPKQLGRVRVRIINEHDEDVDTGDIDWAHIIMPSTSACVDGVGDTPNLAVGSRVVGFYMDGNEKQMPMVMGSFPTIPGNDASRHSLSWLHRGKNILTKDIIGPEPSSPYAAQYPFNRTITTKGGHVIELDDTPGNARINIHHSSGAYIEINNDGRMVIKAPSDSIDVIGGVKTVYAKGDIDIVSENNVTIAARKGIKMGAPGGVTITEGSLMVKGAISSAVGVSGTFTTPTGKVVEVLNGVVVNIS